MPFKYPIYRVALNNHKFYPDVFLFYKINKPDKKFFWYPFLDRKKIIGESIAEALDQQNL